jgi:hypothetical protein
MWQDPIVAEVRRVRRAHAAQFEFDLKTIYETLKKQEKQSQRKTVSFPPRRIQPITAEKSALEV